MFYNKKKGGFYMNKEKKLALSIGGYEFFIKAGDNQETILKNAQKLDDDIKKAVNVNPHSPLVLNIILTALEYTEKLSSKESQENNMRDLVSEYIKDIEALKKQVSSLKEQNLKLERELQTYKFKEKNQKY